jgi:hypothetical protein
MAADSAVFSPHPDLFPPARVAELIMLATALYPHPDLRDGPYTRTVSSIITQAASDPGLYRTLSDGLRDLAQITTSPIRDMDSTALDCLLRAVEQTTFFNTLRPLVAFHLYDDREVWEFIGYPGSSFEQGGYLHRGFDDLAWLPQPRIEEPAEPLLPIGPLPTTSPDVTEYARTAG